MARILKPPTPITLEPGEASVFLAGSIEMGLAEDCPPGYWRRGNVEVVCSRHGIPLVQTLPDLVQHLRQRLLV